MAKTVKRLIYVISNINNSLGFEWLADGISPNKYKVGFIFLNPEIPPIMKLLESRGIETKFIRLGSKTDLPFVILKLIKHFFTVRPDIVHCHLFEASIAGMLSAWFCRVKRRIYTRHHSTLHHKEHPSAVKYDKLVNYCATDIVAVTKVVADVLEFQEDVPAKKICIIHHGFHLHEFSPENISAERIDTVFRKYNPGLRKPVIGVISRFVEWKGVQYIIPAFKQLLINFPEALLILANAKGNFEDEINQMLKQLPEPSYCTVPFENDIFALYRLFDVFVHVPVSNDAEAFGQIYVEALAAGVCMVCTHSGISKEVVRDNENAFVVSYMDSDSILQKMMLVLNDNNLADRIRRNAAGSVEHLFSVRVMVSKLEELYG